MTDHDDANRLSRRRLLGLGAGAAGAIVLAPGARAATAANEAVRGGPTSAVAATRSDRFGRIFKLPPFAEPSERVTAALLELGKPGGPLDARDALERGPKDLIVDLSLSAANPNNPDAYRGDDLLRPVHRPRHHVRRLLAGSADRPRPRVRATSAHPRSTSTPSTARGRSPIRRSTTRPIRRSSSSRAEGSSKTCRAPPTTARSSPTRATTST